MANRTVKDAHTVHGTNPQYLVEKIIRSRIYESRYWKEECFAVNEELLVERAAALKYIGGVHGGNIKPTPFMCLTLKMLQIQPAKDIVIEFIRQQDYKYARALGVFYLRLTHDSLECFRYLEPLFNDYRKLKRVDRQGVFSVVHMDEFVDELLREERSCDVILPRLQKRHVLEEEGDLEVRVSLLDVELQDVRLSDAEDDSGGSLSPPVSPRPPTAAQQRHQRRSRSPSPPARPDRRKRSRSLSKSKSPPRSPPPPPPVVERHRKVDADPVDAGSSEPKKRKKEKEKEKEKEKRGDKDRDRNRDRDQNKDREGGRDRDRGRNKDRERDRNEDKADRSKDRGGRDRDRDAVRDRHRAEHKRSSRPDEGSAGRRERDTAGGRGRGADLEEEIREANKLRAELGIPLLKP